MLARILLEGVMNDGEDGDMTTCTASFDDISFISSSLNNGFVSDKLYSLSLPLQSDAFQDLSIDTSPPMQSILTFLVLTKE